MSALPRNNSPSYADLKDGVDCRVIADVLGFRLKEAKADRSLYFQIAGENTASVWVYQHYFKNFGTGGQKGDVYALIQYGLGASRKEAYHWLKDYRSGVYVVPPRRTTPVPPKTPSTTPPDAKWQDKAWRIIQECSENLWTPTGQAALKYLHKRGLSDETIRAASIGFASAEYIQENFGNRKTSNGIIIPRIVGGQVWAVKYRRSSNEPKYRQLSGGRESSALFGANDIEPGKPICAVEGEFDALIGKQHAGDLVTFVTTGSADYSIPPHELERLKAAPIILAAHDNDPKGHEARAKLIAALPGKVAIATVPSGKDLTDFATSGGDVRAWITHELATARPATVTQQWGRELPAVFNRVWKAFKLAPSVIVLLLAVLRKIAEGELDPANLTIPGIVAKTGLTDRQVRNGLEKDSGLVFTFSACRESLEKKNLESTSKPSAENVEKRSEGRPAIHFALKPLDNVIAGIVDRIVIPRLKMKHFPAGDPKRYAPPDLELLQAAGLDESWLDVLQQHLIYPAGNVEALRAFSQELDRWRFALKDLSPLSLELPEDEPITNSKTLNAALIARRAKITPEGAKLSYKTIADDTGLSRRTVIDSLPWAGVGMVENRVNVPFASTSALPEPTYDPQHEGTPDRLWITDEHGEIKDLPYSERVDGEIRIRPEVSKAAALAFSQQQRVEVSYRQAGSPYLLSKTERQEALAKQKAKQAAKPKKQRAKGNEKDTVQSSAPRFDTPGYKPQYALLWRGRLPEQLPGDIAAHVLNAQANSTLLHSGKALAVAPSADSSQEGETMHTEHETELDHAAIQLPDSITINKAAPLATLTPPPMPTAELYPELFAYLAARRKEQDLVAFPITQIDSEPNEADPELPVVDDANEQRIKEAIEWINTWNAEIDRRNAVKTNMIQLPAKAPDSEMKQEKMLA